MKNKAFVLVELLIAVAILSVVLFYLSPTTVNLFKTDISEDVLIINSIAEKALTKAKKTNRPQVIWGIKGSTNIHFDNKSYQLSESIFDVKINGLYQTNDRYEFFVYPQGLMDNVVIFLSNDKKILSSPLLVGFRLE